MSRRLLRLEAQVRRKAFETVIVYMVSNRIQQQYDLYSLPPHIHFIATKPFENSAVGTPESQKGLCNGVAAVSDL